ncbi:MAG: FG-GAP repeat protein [Deltaproteobacteria bacterium]|nr:FG-GAP repeat protein [Deltaproteobacteria bacterium]
MKSSFGVFRSCLIIIAFFAVPQTFADIYESVPDWVRIGDGGDFGKSVAMVGDVNGDGYDDLLIGAETKKVDVEDEGEVYLFFGSATGPTIAFAWSARGGELRTFFGSSVAGAGDVNGDGFADIVLGAKGDSDLGHLTTGEIRLYTGSVEGPGSTATSTLFGMTQGSWFGSSVAGAGDVDGDGFDDVVVGAPFDSSMKGKNGAAYIYRGFEGGLLGVPTVLTHPTPLGDFGYSVAGAGDVNGDGYADVIVGQPEYDGSGVQGGAVHIYFGSADVSGDAPDWSFTSDQGRQAKFADCVRSAGDVNGDGFDDILVGAWRYHVEGQPRGAAFLFLGSEDGPSTEPDWIGYPTNFGPDYGISDSFYGLSLDSAGDVDGDGLDDVIVGSAGWASAAHPEVFGGIFLYRGSEHGLKTTPELIVEPPDQPWHEFGRAVAGAGDMNGDGLVDIVGGTPYHNDGDVTHGAVAVYFGAESDDDDDGDDDEDDDDDAGGSGGSGDDEVADVDVGDEESDDSLRAQDDDSCGCGC